MTPTKWIYLGVILLVGALTYAWFANQHSATAVKTKVGKVTSTHLTVKMDSMASRLDTETSRPVLDSIGFDIIALGKEDEAGTVHYVLDYAKSHDDQAATFLLSAIKTLPLRKYGNDFLAAYQQLGPDQRSQVRDILASMAMIKPGEDTSTIDTDLLANIQKFFRTLATSSSGDEQKEAVINFTQIAPSEEALQFLYSTFLSSENLSEKTYQSLAIEIAISTPDMASQFLPQLLRSFSTDTGIDRNTIINKLATAASVVPQESRATVADFLATFKPEPAADPTFAAWIQAQITLGAPTTTITNTILSDNNPLDLASLALFSNTDTFNTYRAPLENKITSLTTTGLGENETQFIVEAKKRLAHGS